MPWSRKQVKTFRALEHGWKPTRTTLGSLLSLGKEKLGRMADEGVKKGKKKRKR